MVDRGDVSVSRVQVIHVETRDQHFYIQGKEVEALVTGTKVALRLKSIHDLEGKSALRSTLGLSAQALGCTRWLDREEVRVKQACSV